MHSIRVAVIFIFVPGITVMMFGTVSADFAIVGLPSKKFVRLGDLNLGAILPIYNSGDRYSLCGDSLLSTSVIQFAEAIVHAVDLVNNDSQILPNTSLGFAILNNCRKVTTTLAQTVAFVPQDPHGVAAAANASSGNVTSYDVIGVVGPVRSVDAIAASYLLSAVQMPVISFSATSDELSNKDLHPYFMRVVSPDEFQVKAIFKFILHHKWSYISVVYSEGSYGETAFKNLKKLTNAHGICIATAIKVNEGAVDHEYNLAVKELLSFERARVVVLIGGPVEIREVFLAVKRANAKNRFIWIGTDGWSSRMDSLIDVIDYVMGALTTNFYPHQVPSFVQHYRSLRPSTAPNPWFPILWETHFGCSFAAKSCNESWELSKENGFTVHPQVPEVMDTVITFARATDRLLRDNCPQTTGRAARECVNRPLLLQYLMNTSFEGMSGTVAFDANGNRLGRYEISQVLPSLPYFHQHPVAFYDTITEAMEMVDPINWSYLSDVNQSTNSSSNITPISRCSEPCQTGEFLTKRELPCCWDCRRCRDNEYIIEDGTNCRPCPEFYWPDLKTNLTSCSRITPDVTSFTSSLGILQLVLAVIGLTGLIGIVVLYVKHFEARIIKASSRELSLLMLLGILLGFITVIVNIFRPSDVSCKLVYVLFCQSFCWIYGPLVVRTCRMYRIFNSAKNSSSQRLRFISQKSQVFFSFLIISGQMLICSVVIFRYNPTARLTMAVYTEPYVELSCDVTFQGLVAFLTYILILILLCSIFAFHTRKLPDNFNESRFISMCVYTTLVIWLAFIPSYFSAGAMFLKALLLSLALILNHTVAILFLYLPKIYAVQYVRAEEQKSGRQVLNEESRCANISLGVKQLNPPVSRLSSITATTSQMGY